MNLEKHGFLLLKQSPDLDTSFVEWMALPSTNAPISSPKIVRIYKEDNKIIIYKEGENLSPNEILFNGRIETLELFELIYKLVS